MSDASRYFEDLSAVIRKVQATLAGGQGSTLAEGLEHAIQLVLQSTGQGRKLMFIGNGGSAAIASHQAVDYWKNGGLRAVAFNDSSLLTCIGNDYGYPHIFEKPIEMFADPGDVLLAISSSGKSENILRGAKAALQKGCRVITLSGFKPDNPLRSLGSVNFYAASSSYGYVEITHLALCHSIVDTIIGRRD